MKNRNIIICCIISCLILLITPNISAIEYKTVELLYKDALIEQSTLIEINENIISLIKEGKLLDKAITILLFFVYLIYTIVYNIIYPKISQSLLNFVKEIEIETPLQTIFALFIILLSFPGSIYISMIPLFFISDIINEIGAWDKEILNKIQQSIILIVGISMWILELIGILDVYPDLNNEEI